jgi:hypothetical protein
LPAIWNVQVPEVVQEQFIVEILPSGGTKLHVGAVEELGEYCIVNGFKGSPTIKWIPAPGTIICGVGAVTLTETSLEIGFAGDPVARVKVSLPEPV